MKNISIKIKITLWYTIFMTLLVILVLGILLETGSTRFFSNTTNRLKNTVIRSFKEISFEHNRLDFDDDFVYVTYGKEYRVLGFSKDGAYLVMDDSHMCYFYSPKFFEVIRDDHGILDKEKSLPVYDWKNTHIDSV